MKTTSELRIALAEKANDMNLDITCSNDGTIHSQIAVIGEAPGFTEISKGKPFVGGSGNLLWTTLRKYKLNRVNVYSTNVCKRQVSFGNDKRHPINKNETEHWISLLKWEIAQLPNCKYLLVLGNIALQAIYNVSGVTNWRGSVLEVEIHGRKYKCLITLNPAMIIREPKHEITFLRDLAKFNLVINDNWHMKNVTANINPTYEEAMQWLEYYKHTDNAVTYDIEVISNETACIGFADSIDEGTCIPFRTIKDNFYSNDQEKQIRLSVNDLLRKEDVKLVAQNGMFDASWLAYKDRIVPHKHYFDTMLAHHLLYPQLPHNLGYITTQYTSRPFYKDDGKNWKEGGNIDDFWIYNVEDCCNTHEAHIKMHKELKDQSLDKFFFEHIMRLQPHLINMTVGGVRMDMEGQQKVQEQLQIDIANLQEQFDEAVHEATGDSDLFINYRSPKEMSELLFTKLKLVGRGASTAKVNRDNMYKHSRTTEPSRKVLKIVDKLSEEGKFYSTYAKMRTDPDNRIRCTYNQTGVQSAPGRLSSSGMLWGTGMNLQNQPRRAQSLFVADPNYCLIYFDLAQAEARLVAWYANIETWKEQFEKARLEGGYDAHRALAAEMWGINYDDVPISDYDSTGQHTIRYIAKRCRHGLNYRMQPDRLAQTAGLSVIEAHKAYNIYHRLTPELQEWWNSLEQEITQTKTLYNALGRRFILLERKSTKALDAIVAFKPQSTNGDHTARVIYLSEDDKDWHPSGRMLLNIHDANIALVRKEHAMKSLMIMKKYAEKPIMINGEPLIIPADMKMSHAGDDGVHRWSGMKSVEM